MARPYAYRRIRLVEAKITQTFNVGTLVGLAAITAVIERAVVGRLVGIYATEGYHSFDDVGGWWFLATVVGIIMVGLAGD